MSQKNQNEQDQESSDGNDSSLGDLHNIKMDDLDHGDENEGITEADEHGQFPEEEAEIEGGDFEEAVDKITREVFWQGFQAAFAGPGMFDKDFEPVAIQPNELAPGRAASDVFYDLIEKYFPDWLSGQDFDWLKIAAAFYFVYGKIKIASMIMAMKRAEASQPAQPHGPADPASSGGDVVDMQPSEGVDWYEGGNGDEAA